jgi:hypothetical protein
MVLQQQYVYLNINRKAASNIHDMLSKENRCSDLSMDDFAQLKNDCFLYQPKTNTNERLIMGFCSNEQKESAWKYGHNNYIMMDGTFGISRHCVLTFILMVIDPVTSHGIPVAFFLFSPKHEAGKTCSSYDEEILELFLQKWQAFMNEGKDSIFMPRVCIVSDDLTRMYI